MEGGVTLFTKNMPLLYLLLMIKEGKQPETLLARHGNDTLDMHTIEQDSRIKLSPADP
jgi:hypothetical protein